MKKILSIVMSCVLLGGCSTGYQKLGYDGGYSEMRTAKNSYMVEYTSNAYTDQSTNFKYALRRAAELTQMNGYKYFQVTNSANTSSQYTTPRIATTNANAYGYGSYNGFGHAHGNSTTVISGGDTYTKPGVALVITMLNKKTNDAYDASIVLSNFKDN